MKKRFLSKLALAISAFALILVMAACGSGALGSNSVDIGSTPTSTPDTSGTSAATATTPVGATPDTSIGGTCGPNSFSIAPNASCTTGPTQRVVCVGDINASGPGTAVTHDSLANTGQVIAYSNGPATLTSDGNGASCQTYPNDALFQQGITAGIAQAKSGCNCSTILVYKDGVLQP